MSNLRRPLILGLSTCALILLSTCELKRKGDIAVREHSEPSEDEETMRSEMDAAATALPNLPKTA